jgi:hypothetical protein
MIHKTKNTFNYEINGKNLSVNEQLQLLSANMLQVYSEHYAGKGSKYIHIGNFKIRIANHLNTSKSHESPDLNIVGRKLNQEDYLAIKEKINYPDYCKQGVFSKHVGLSIPKLKKLLPESCFEDVVENDFYYNTKTKMIKTLQALDILTELGFNERIPISQEITSIEDYCGY